MGREEKGLTPRSYLLKSIPALILCGRSGVEMNDRPKTTTSPVRFEWATADSRVKPPS